MQLVAEIRRDNPMNHKCSLDEKELKNAKLSLKSVGKLSVLCASENLTT